MNDNLPVTSKPEAPALATILGVSPKQMMTYAIEISETLTAVLRQRGLTKKFGQGEHVLVEGWELAGSLLGLTVAEKSCVELPDGSFLAEVQLQNPTTGKALATATGYCGIDEDTWKRKPKYARRGMAMTRAIGRVYRQNFSWLIKLAGFEPTPAEEMPDNAQDILTGSMPPPFPSVEIYTATTAQETRLAMLLKQEKVPEELWEKIGIKMTGTPMTKSTVKDLIAETLAEASAI